MIPEIVRPKPGEVGSAAGLAGTRAAARRVDITPELGLGMAGHGPDTDRAHGAMGRLWANVLVVDDGQEERVALITIDMMAGSRFLAERLAERVAGTTGLSVERIFLAGSHTHRAPGWVWGHGTYDRITATADLARWDAHFDLALADALVARLAGAVTEACAALSHDDALATIGYGAAFAPRSAWNRSLEASLTRPPPGRPRPDPDPPPGAEWKRPAHYDDDDHIRALHALLNGGDEAPEPKGAPEEAEEAPPEAADDAIGDGAIGDGAEGAGDGPEGFAPPGLPGLPPPPPPPLPSPEPADSPFRFAMYRDLLRGDDEVDGLPDGLKELRRRFQRGDEHLTMDDILRVMLDQDTSSVEIAGFLGRIRTWAEGNGRWWDKREERWGERLVTDSRVHALAAFRERDGGLIGAFCTFGATPSIVGAHAAVYCGDGFAGAVDRLRLRRGDPDLAVGIAGGALGDANLCHPDRSALDVKEDRQRIDALIDVLDGAADALALAVHRALDVARDRALADVRLRVALAEPDPSAATVRVDWLATPRKLPKHAAFGFSTLAASDLGQSDARKILSEELFVEYKGGAPFPPTAEEHLPKPQLPRFAFDPSPLPIRVVSLEGRTRAGETERIALAGLPAEISTLLGYEAATALAAALGDGTRAFVAGPVGDYCSYFSTVWEYTAQHYEGASSPWGRWSGDWLISALCDAARALPRPLAGTRATFSGRVGAPERGLSGVKKVGEKRRTVPRLGHPALEALAGEVFLVVGDRARGAWTEPADASRHRPLWAGPLVELLDAQGDVARTRTGLLAHDVHLPALLWCEELDGGLRRWRWEIRLPDLASPVAAARVGAGAKRVLQLHPDFAR